MKQENKNLEIELPCYCWEGYKCDFCKIREMAFEEVKNKYKPFNNKFEQNAEQFIKDAITITVQEFTKGNKRINKAKEQLTLFEKNKCNDLQKND